jgi:hypothetical protein
MPQYYDRDHKSHYQKKRYLLKTYGIGKEELDIKFEMIHKKVIIKFD